MDMTKFETKKYIKAEDVVTTKVDKAMIKTAGKQESGKFGDQVVFEVRYNNRNCLYSPNGKSVENLNKGYGRESEEWIGKSITFRVEKNTKGDNTLIAYPEAVVEEEVKG